MLRKIGVSAIELTINESFVYGGYDPPNKSAWMYLTCPYYHPARKREDDGGMIVVDAAAPQRCGVSIRGTPDGLQQSTTDVYAHLTLRTLPLGCI